MRSADVQELLQLVAAAARRGEDLIPVLAAADAPGPALAERLRVGVSLVDALHEELNPLQRWLLLGPRPGLAEGALLAADLIDQERQRRRLALTQLSYPVLVLGLITAAVTLIRVEELPLWQAPPAVWAGAALLALLAGAAVLPTRYFQALPWLAAWRTHGEAAWRYRAIAIGLDHRLDEARLRQCFGQLPEELLRLAAAGDGSVWCRHMADWHQQRAQTWLLVSLLVASAAIFLIAGGLVLGFHTGMLDYQQEMIRRQGL